MDLDAHDTLRCPRGHRCESCGVETSGLSVKVIDVLAATMCLTMCPACASSGRPPTIMLSTAERLVDAHRRHLAGYDTAG